MKNLNIFLILIVVLSFSACEKKVGTSEKKTTTSTNTLSFIKTNGANLVDDKGKFYNFKRNKLGELVGSRRVYV